jgi:hypothetical protein
VSGQPINSKQIQIYLKSRMNGQTQETAAAKGGFSVRTGRRIEKGEHQPQKGQARDWRTREDPYAEVWESEIVPMLEKEPKLRPMTIFEYLQEKYPEKYSQSKLRTLQKRVSEWKAAHGEGKEVMFAQEHQPGEMGLSDFTHFKQATITIAGQPFEHLLYHYRLAYSGWQYVQIVKGGESFIALSEGLQKALSQSGGSPKIHRTDSLSAAYRNEKQRTEEDVTQRYEELCAHYQMQATRNNRGIAHENGSIESSHGYFKRRLHQALLLRGSMDFETVESYQQFIETVIVRLNQKCHERFEEEQGYLQALPTHSSVDYEILSVRVTCHSTITVRCVLYTVPSRLIGQRLSIHLYHDRLLGFLNQKPVLTLGRVYPQKSSDKRRARSVDYRHVIDSLRRKPRAFLGYKWREDLLPNDSYRRIWQGLQEKFKPYEACRLMVEALYLAASLDKEYVVGLWLETRLRDATLTLQALQKQFAVIPAAPLTVNTVEQHSLIPYDQLLAHDFHCHCPAHLTHSSAISSPASHETSMAGVGKPCYS